MEVANEGSNEHDASNGISGGVQLEQWRQGMNWQGASTPTQFKAPTTAVDVEIADEKPDENNARRVM